MSEKLINLENIHKDYGGKVVLDNINLYVITAYYPDTKKFEDDLRTRRKG